VSAYEETLGQLVQAMKVAKAKGDKVAQAKLRRQYEQLKEAKSGPSYLGGLARSVLGQGLGLGFGDEAEAWALSKLHGTDYQTELQHARAQQQKWSEENPVADFAGQVAGGLVPGIGVARGVGMAAKGVGRLGQLMGAGGLEGAVIGAGTAEEGGRLEGALTGAAIGTAAGAAGRGIERWMGGRAQRLAASKLERALADAGYQGTPSDIAFMARRAVEDMGSDTILADTDAALRRLLGSAARATRSPGEIEDFVKSRQRASTGRIGQQIEQVTGVRESPLQARDRLAQMRRGQATADYGRVSGEAVQVSPAMRQALAYPEGQRAANDALDRMRMEYSNPNLTLDDAMNGLDFWDGWQKAMRSQSDSAARTGDNYRAGLLGDLRRRVVDELDMQPGVSGRMGTDYAQARRNFAVATRVEEAVDTGDLFLRMTPEELQRELVNMTSQERQALVLGAIGKVQRDLTMSPDGANKARNIVKSSAMRQKLEILLGPQKAEDLIVRMDDEIEKVTTDYMLTGGSHTGRLAAADAGNIEEGVGAALPALMSGDVGGATRAALGSVARNVMPRQMTPGTADELLKVLGETDPARLEQMIEAALRGMPADERLVPGALSGLGAALAPNPEAEMGYDPYRMRIEITPP
jgi:hypothetical protein